MKTNETLYAKIQSEFDKLSNASALDVYFLKCRMYQGKKVNDLTKKEFENFIKEARKLYKERNTQWKKRKHRKRSY